MTCATTLEGFARRIAEVRGVRLRYYVGGTGSRTPVVLLHGLGGAASNWVELAPGLARRRRVLVPDLPGHGGSSPLPAAPSLEPYARLAGALAEREGMLPGALVGHSLGGVVALRLARQRPGQIRGVVLAGAAGIGSSSRLGRLVLGLVGLVRPGRLVAPFREPVSRTPWLRRAVLGSWGASDARSLSAVAAEGFLAGTALHTDVVGAAAALARDDARELLSGVRCPCLVLWGANDLQTPIADAFEFARQLRAQLRVIPDCGHLLIAERHDACLDAIETFLGD